eukprot:m51a1_g13585 hypothetical protein (146) ;mRNA; f:1473-2024
MNASHALAALLGLCCLSAALAAPSFDDFAALHRKRYAPYERATRRAIYERNMRDAELLNAANPHAVFGATVFSDLTPDEFASLYLTNATDPLAPLDLSASDPAQGAAANPERADKLPGRFDWRDRGAITFVKNQYTRCGTFRDTL